MAKIALITDTHFGARNDSIQFLKYYQKFYKNVFFKYIDEHKIDTIFHLGDIVERRKFINFITLHQFKRMFIQPMIDRNITFHCIVGNHDIPYRNSNEISAMSELFANQGKHNMHLYWKPEDVIHDGVSIGMLPWINNDNYEECMNYLKDTPSQIIFSHLELSGFEVFNGQIHDVGMARTPFEKFDVVCSGHYHHKSSQGNIHYLGNPYELTWADYNDPRGFHIFDTDTRELTFIQNPYKMFYKVWYDDTNKKVEDYAQMDFTDYADTYVKVIVQNKTNPYSFDIMLDKLYKANPANVSIVDDHKHMDQQSEEEIFNEAEDTLTTLNRYVDGMDTNIDRVKLQRLFAELYTEAQHLEV